MADYIADVFMTLDGFGTGTEGYWGKDGPELRAQRADIFADPDQTFVFGANTYRMMARFAPMELEPSHADLNAAPKVIVSRSLETPLTWTNCTLVAEDAVTAIPRLKAESDVPLRGHGSLAMNRSLLAAGLVDRLEVTLFPIVNGATGANPVLAGLPDIDLELIESEPLDGQVQRLVYRPTLR